VFRESLRLVFLLLLLLLLFSLLSLLDIQIREKHKIISGIDCLSKTNYFGTYRVVFLIFMDQSCIVVLKIILKQLMKLALHKLTTKINQVWKKWIYSKHWKLWCYKYIKIFKLKYLPISYYTTVLLNLADSIFITNEFIFIPQFIFHCIYSF